MSRIVDQIKSVKERVGDMRARAGVIFQKARRVLNEKLDPEVFNAHNASEELRKRLPPDFEEYREHRMAVEPVDHKLLVARVDRLVGLSLGLAIMGYYFPSDKHLTAVSRENINAARAAVDHLRESEQRHLAARRDLADAIANHDTLKRIRLGLIGADPHNTPAQHVRDSQANLRDYFELVARPANSTVGVWHNGEHVYSGDTKIADLFNAGDNLSDVINRLTTGDNCNNISKTDRLKITPDGTDAAGLIYYNGKLHNVFLSSGPNNTGVVYTVTPQTDMNNSPADIYALHAGILGMANSYIARVTK